MILTLAVGVALAVPTLEFELRTARMSLSDPSSQSIAYFVRNQTSRSIVVWHSHFSANHVLRLIDEAGRPMPLTPKGRRLKADFDAGGSSRDKNVAFIIPPGKTDPVGGTPRLGEYFVFRPGHYRLTLEYCDQRGGMDGRPKGFLRLISLPLPIIVSP